MRPKQSWLRILFEVTYKSYAEIGVSTTNAHTGKSFDSNGALKVCIQLLGKFVSYMKHQRYAYGQGRRSESHEASKGVEKL
jgi:hypothetical protein